MDKREKYINYIVDEMVKNTHISYITVTSENIERQVPLIYPPFGGDANVMTSIDGVSPRLFSKHLHDVYGVNEDDYTFIIFCMNLYKEKLKPLVVYKNNYIFVNWIEVQ